MTASWREQGHDENVGRRAEGFALDQEGKFPEFLTTEDGKTYTRGFDDPNGNYFYTRLSEDKSLREFLLIDKQGTILSDFKKNEGVTSTSIKENTPEQGEGK